MDINATTLDAIYQNLNKAFEEGQQSVTPIAEPLYKVVPSTSRSEAYSWLSQIPTFREWFQGQSRVLRNVESLDFEVSNREFELTISIPVNDIKDNKLGQYDAMGSKIGAQGKLVYDEIVFDLFNKGFTTALTYDGKPWFSDSHAIGLSTIDNKGTAALAEASLDAAITQMMSYTVQADKLSTPVPLNPSSELILVVPPALYMQAKKLVEVPTVAGGGDNYLYGSAKVLVSSYLTSSTAWFLVNVANGERPVFLQEREPLTLLDKTASNSDYVYLNNAALYGGSLRCAALPTFPYLSYGSTGEA